MSDFTADPGPATQQTEAVTWAALLDRCSRLHTMRWKPLYPGATECFREASEMADVDCLGTRWTVVPTRMHEPGFYLRSGDTIWRSDGALEEFHRLVDLGAVSWSES